MGDMTRLLLLLWAGVTVSTAVHLLKRVINGQPCGANERHYHVAFVDDDNDLHCGGSLISDQWILTAAHCWTWSMRAALGLHGPGPLRVDLITAKPEIYGDNNNHNNVHDMMLVRLPNPTPVTPVPVPDEQACRNRPPVNRMVRVAGLAATGLCLHDRRDNDRPDDVQCGNMPVVNCQGLRNLMQNQPLFNELHHYQHFFCAQSPANQQPRVDISPGDSGGGVEFNGMIYGVNSFTGNGEFAFVEPAAFMDVCDYRPWIEGIVGVDVLNRIRQDFRNRQRQP